MNRRLLIVAAGIVVGIPILAWASFAFFVRPRLVGWVEDAAERSFDAEVELGQVGVDLLSGFPRVSVSLSSLSVRGRAPFEGVELLKLGPSRVEVDLLSALGSELKIEGIRLTDPSVRVLVLEDGRSNLDTFVGTSSAEESAGGSSELSLQDVEITGLSAVYEDRSSDLVASVGGLDVSLEGLVGTPTRFDVTAKATSVDVASGGTRWLDRAALDAHVEMEQSPDGTLTLNDNLVRVNTFPLAFGGTLAPSGDATRVDVTFSSPESSLPGLLSLLPGTTAGSVARVKAAGTVAFEGSVKGTWPGADPEAYPAFDLALRLADASFRFPDLPAGVDRLALDLALHHPEGPAGATEIDARSFELSVAGQALSGRLSVRDPLGDPAVDTSIHGALDLAALRSTWPAMADGAPAAGRLVVEVDVKGRMSDFEQGRVDQVTCAGTVSGSGIHYLSEGWPELIVDRFALTLSPEAFDLGEASVSWEGSDSRWKGGLEHVVPFLVRGDTLVGRMTLDSQRMDLRPFQGDTEEAPTAASGEEGAIAAVPTWVDFRMDATIGRLVTQEFEMERVRGTLLVKDGAVAMDPIEADMMGGRVTLRGNYRAPDTSGADLELEVTAVQLQLGQAFATFETLGRLAPVLDGAKTSFDSGFSMKARLLADGSPDLPTLVSKGMFLPAAATLTPKVLQGLAQELHTEEVSALRVGGSRIAWSVEGGRAAIDAFTAKLGPLDARIWGSAGVVDQTLDFKVSSEAPAALLAAAAVQGRGKKAKARDAGSAEIVATIGGTWAKPTLKVSIGGMSAGELVEEAAKEVLGKAVGDLVAEASRKGDALIAAAEAQAERLRAEARTAAKKLEDEAAKQGKRLVAEAGSNPLQVAAAKEASKKLSKEAKGAGEKLVSEADRGAQKGISEAKAKKLELITEAERRSGQ